MRRNNLELYTAIEEHDLDGVRALLAHGADPNEPREDGWRPLHVAIGRLGVGGPIEVVAALIEHGADVNAWDTNRHETPILSAADPANAEAVRILLEAGADPNARRSTHESPLQLCVEQKALEAAALLLRHGATTTMDEWGGLRGLTPLGMAARQFDIAMIELLLREGADPEALDEYSEPARDKLPPREVHDPVVWDRMWVLLKGRVR